MQGSTSPGQFVFEERAGESVPSVLYDEHVKLTSKSHITAFAGYLMPLWYSSIARTQSTDGPEKPHPNRREPKSLSTPKDNGLDKPRQRVDDTLVSPPIELLGRPWDLSNSR